MSARLSCARLIASFVSLTLFDDPCAMKRCNAAFFGFQRIEIIKNLALQSNSFSFALTSGKFQSLNSRVE